MVVLHSSGFTGSFSLEKGEISRNASAILIGNLVSRQSPRRHRVRNWIKVMLMNGIGTQRELNDVKRSDPTDLPD